jgi:hypothetical protein
MHSRGHIILQRNSVRVTLCDCVVDQMPTYDVRRYVGCLVGTKEWDEQFTVRQFREQARLSRSAYSQFSQTTDLLAVFQRRGLTGGR